MEEKIEKYGEDYFITVSDKLRKRLNLEVGKVVNVDDIFVL